MTPDKKQMQVLLHYIHERELIRLRKEAGQPWPWTDDAILRTYKFTNVRRLHDRTTQALLAIYRARAPKAPPESILVNCATYRYFGTIEMAQAVGWQNKWSAVHTLGAAKRLIARGGQAFTGAYIISNNGRSGPKEGLVVEYLTGLNAVAGAVCEALHSQRSWQAAYEEMHKVYGFGGSGFMAKEVLQDVLLTRLGKCAGDAEAWTPVGPGARRGLNRLAGRGPAYEQGEARWSAEVSEVRAAVQPHWRRWFPKDAALSAHDVQFCLCEFSKYSKVLLGEGQPRSRYQPHIVRAALA